MRSAWRVWRRFGAGKGAGDNECFDILLGVVDDVDNKMKNSEHETVAMDGGLTVSRDGA